MAESKNAYLSQELNPYIGIDSNQAINFKDREWRTMRLFDHHVQYIVHASFTVVVWMAGVLQALTFLCQRRQGEKERRAPRLWEWVGYGLTTSQ